MNFVEDFKEHIFDKNDETFEDSSLALFDFQYHNNQIYQRYCKQLGIMAKAVQKVDQIPFLPIEFFKTHEVSSSYKAVQKVFKSSGTTAGQRSKHCMSDLGFYEQISQQIFEGLLGEISQYTLIALLPSYLEQGDSSLIYMVDHFIKKCKEGSGYYLEKDIATIIAESENPMLFGVSYALLDMPSVQYEDLLIIETGGMKGRKKEITREELHNEIRRKTEASNIWSEYGMTELTSQAYGTNGTFSFPAWATVLIREVNDPFSYQEQGKTGALNIIDLANVESCAFIETKDLGIIQEAKNFKVLGRLDNSDLRGCNLLV
ncbi:MAG: acyl transferase [Bacteroidota bacterium]